MATIASDAVDGVPIATGVAAGLGMASGDFYTMAGMETYVVPPRNPASFDGRALLLLPDMTGVLNLQNRLLAGASTDLCLQHAEDSPHPSPVISHRPENSAGAGIMTAAIGSCNDTCSRVPCRCCAQHQVVTGHVCSAEGNRWLMPNSKPGEQLQGIGELFLRARAARTLVTVLFFTTSGSCSTGLGYKGAFS